MKQKFVPVCVIEQGNCKLQGAERKKMEVSAVKQSGETVSCKARRKEIGNFRGETEQGNCELQSAERKKMEVSTVKQSRETASCKVWRERKWKFPR